MTTFARVGRYMVHRENVNENPLIERITVFFFIRKDGRCIRTAKPGKITSKITVRIFVLEEKKMKGLTHTSAHNLPEAKGHQYRHPTG